MIRLVYRSYGGENMKSRPDYYDKTMCLASFMRAAERAGLEALYLNDGPIPEPRLTMMRRSGEVSQIEGGPVGMRASYRKTWELPKERGWADDDLVYFSEDDYIYHPDAFVALAEAEQQLDRAVYFSLYGSTNQLSNRFEFPDGEIYPQGFRRQPDKIIGDITWVNIPSTASTFGGRAGAVTMDYSIMRQSMYPFRNRYQDHETCLVYQGHAPYTATELLLGTVGQTYSYPWTPWGMARRFGLLPFRVALNAKAWTRRNRPHPLYVAEPNLACHLDTPVITPGRDWAAIAADTRAWLEQWQGTSPVAAT